MIKKYTFIFLTILLFSYQIYGQSFTEQILNKEQFKSAVSLTQDYDNDGDLDIIVSRWEPAGIYVLDNDGTKQFPATPIITEDIPFYIADIDMADFDNDGDIDYVVCFTGVNDGELAWFQRQDNGTYQKWTIATNKDYIMADVGDFNNDGLMDVAAVGLINSDETGRVYLNEGNLFFSETIVANGVYEAVDAEDFDGDGDIDLALTGIGSVDTQNGNSTGSRILLNDGNGSFSLGRWLNDNYFNFSSFWDRIEFVDLNADGVQDVLALSSVASAGLKFFDGTNVGPYNDLEAITLERDDISGLSGDFIVFDVDNNGFLDIVCQNRLNDRLFVLYQTSTLSFHKEYIELNWDDCCNPVAQMSIGDLDNDGDLDLVFPEQGNVDEDVSWFENIDGSLFKHQITGKLDGVRIPKMVDWDGDGDLDIFATVSSSTFGDTEDELILYENIDGVNFVNWRLNDALDYAADVEFADIDGDGDLDAFATARDADDLVWLRNDGFQANWVTDTIFPEGNSPLGIATDDLDGDGDADVVMCSSNDNKVFGFLNNGSGSFSPIVIDANTDGPREVEIADLDNDGDKDIVVVAASAPNSVVVYTNDGAQNFTEEIIFSNEVGQDLEIADWNQDGTLDILACFRDSDVHVVVFINDNGTYLQDTLQLPNDDVISIKVANLDQDSDLDLITGHDENFVNFAPVVFASIFENGELVQSYPLTESVRGEVTGIAVGDVNGDGILDIVYADFDRDDLILLSVGCIAAPTPAITAQNATCDENNGVATVDGAIFENPVFEWSNGATTAMIMDLAAGEYEVTVTDESGCAATASVNIDEIPVAEIEVQGEDTSCGSEDGTASVNILSGNVMSYEWSNGSTTSMISGLPGGTYLVTVTDENNCEIIRTIEVEGLVNPTVDLGEDIVVAQGEPILLDATDDGLTYQWSTGEITSSIMISESGIYSVTVTNMQGCTATDQVEVTITTGLKDLEMESLLAVFPNPTSDMVSINILGADLQPQELRVISSAGTVVQQLQLNPNQKTLEINLKELPPAMYLLSIKTAEGYLYRKIVKE